MKHILGGIFLSVLFFGCRQAQEPPRAAIALCCAASEGSKAEALTADDEIAVFACAEGTEDYFLEAAKFIVDADGRSLNYGSAVYYPDPKEAVRFFAYFPYHTGVFRVPAEQSTTEALKQADLCGAVASTTPVATPVALEFRHLMARVVITTNKPTTRIVFPNAVASGVVRAATAELVLGAERKDIGTDKNELIVPAQPLSRLVLTVANVEYVFEPTLAITLKTGETTTLDLTLHPATKTATLSGSSVTDWGRANTAGTPNHAVSNTLLLHWPTLPQGTAPNKVVFTIDGTDYTVSSGITYANQTFAVPFASQTLRYPYTISKIRFYQSGWLVQSCANLLGATSYKSGAMTVGIKDPANVIKIGRLWWATGNLIADGANGCKIGTPNDCGLYFQFGSLIGWAAGVNGDGTGAQMDQVPLLIQVKPHNLNVLYDPGLNYPINGDQGMLDRSYFSVTSGIYSADGTDIREYTGKPIMGLGVDETMPNLGSGRYAPMGVGDPCTFYLGHQWRTPSYLHFNELLGQDSGKAVQNGFEYAGLFFVYNGMRYNPASFWIGTYTWAWTSSTHNTGMLHYCLHNLNQVGIPNLTWHGNEWSRRWLSSGIRCVSEE